MDVVVTALTSGAVVGLKDAATTAVKDAYAGLVTVIRDRLGHAQAEHLLAVAQDAAADSDTGHDELVGALTEAGIASDEEIMTSARALLAQVDPAGSQAGKYTVDARGAKGAQVGDSNSMTLHL